MSTKKCPQTNRIFKKLGLPVAILILFILLSTFVLGDDKQNPDMQVKQISCTENSPCELGTTPVSSSQDMWDEGAYYWYHVTATGKGKVTFELDLDTDDNDDADLYVYDYTGSNPICSSKKSGNKDEYCEEPTEKTTDYDWEYYIKVHNKVDGGLFGYSTVIIKVRVVQECTEDLVYFCDFGGKEEVRLTGIYSDCTYVENKFIENCDDADDDGTWSSTKCIDNDLKQTKTVKDGYCYMGECKVTTSTETRLIEECDYGCSTGSTECYECTRDSHCSTDEKCSGNKCITKTCSDYPNTDGSCILLGNTKCIGGKDGNPYECKDLGPVNCYQRIDVCTSDEYCKDPIGSGGAQCFEYPCDLTSVSWSKSEAFIDENVEIRVYGDHCHNDDYVTIDIYEDEIIGSDFHKTLGSIAYSTNPLKTSWKVEFIDDGLGQGMPEYFVKAIHNGDTVTSSNLQAVCDDNDEDGFGKIIFGDECGWKADCNDNNANINPDATEICNYKDDNCDGQIDENFDLQNDENNCGSCGNICQSNYVCHTGTCKGCGDGTCNTEIGENPSSCNADCYGDLQIISITNAPTQAREGQSITIKAKLENKGTYQETLNVEAGIAPLNWQGTVFTSKAIFGTSSYIPITKCCPANDYYDAKQITLNPGSSEIVTFSLYAPIPTSVDECDSNTQKASAWDDQHKLIVGIYEQCGTGYIDEINQDIKVYRNCMDKNECPTGEICKFNVFPSFPGVCKYESCTNECSSPNTYSCVGDEIRKCQDIDSDGCLELNYITTCIGQYKCVSGQSNCQVSAPKTEIQIDYSGGSITVNKQYLDILTLRLKYKATETVTLSYDPAIFTLLDCQNTFAITENKECRFSVSNNLGTFDVGINNGDKQQVKIIHNPKTIIITDRAKLIERFNDEQEVDLLLKEAYRRAVKENAVVYDLGDYLNNDLWDSPTQYNGGEYAVK